MVTATIRSPELSRRKHSRLQRDPALYPNYGKPWQAKKLYINGTEAEADSRTGAGGGRGGQVPVAAEADGGQAGAAEQLDRPPQLQRTVKRHRQCNPHRLRATPAGVTINVGEFDPALGRSYSEIAAEGRSLHRSQSQGSAQNKGPNTTSLQLVQKSVEVADNAELFDGVIYKIKDVAQLDASIAADAADLQQRIAAIRQKVNMLRPSEIVPDLMTSFQLLQRIRSKTTNEQVQFC
jgi:hypothetical protein